jgi:hypothetical protein
MGGVVVIVSAKVFEAAQKLAQAFGREFTGEIVIRVQSGGLRRIELLKRERLNQEGE